MKFRIPTAADPVFLHNGDCLEFLRALPDQCVDGVVTSPPYNTLECVSKNGATGKYKGDGFWGGVLEKGYSDAMPEERYQEWIRDVVMECLRVSRGVVWVNHKTRYRAGVGIHPLRFLPFPLCSEVVWDRSSGTAFNPDNKRFVPSHELILGFGSPHYWNDAEKTRFTVWRLNPDRDRHGDEHPCSFPIAIPRRCIRASIPPGGVVLDPFAGSGTTAHAAILEGCRAVLCETRTDYCDVIRRRVATSIKGESESLISSSDFHG